jgi:dTDP-4-dehydrorhamnose 3,5-epimerase
VFEDSRGFFMEVFHQDFFRKAGLPSKFVQLNLSRSSKGVLRGLHFQWEPPMGKLMRVTVGKAFLVAVDIRKNSPTLGEWFGMELSEDIKKQVWAPAGFARGFCVLSDIAEIQYLCTGTFNAACESGISWNDPDIGIQWPIKEPIISEKDMKAQRLSQWLDHENINNFQYSYGD